MGFPSSFTQNSASKLDKAMNPEQFSQVVDAILEGKYSWACVLILRFAGYNPCHYIPRRTYNRLVKENLQAQQQRGSITATQTTSAHRDRVPDLAYLEEALNDQYTQIKGGRFAKFRDPDLCRTWITDSINVKHKLLSNLF